MSETTTPTPETEAPGIPGAPDALQLKKLDEIAGMYPQLYRELNKGDQEASAEAVEAIVAQQIDSYLRKNGITPDSPDYAHVKEMCERAVHTSRADWLAPLADGVVPVSVKASHDIRAQYENAGQSSEAHVDDSEMGGEDLDDVPDEPETEEDEQPSDDADAEEGARQPAASIEIDHTPEEARKRLDELRAEVAKLAAERQGKLFTAFRERYDQAYVNYQAQMVAFGKIGEAELSAADPDRTDDQRRIDVVTFIFEEQQKLRDHTRELLQGTKVGLFVDLMNSGNVMLRMLKGVGVGVAVGAVGAGLVAGGAAVGVAAGATVGVVTAATAAGRFARGFARRENRQDGYGMQQLTEENRDAMLEASTRLSVGPENFEEYLSKSAELSGRGFDRQIGIEQKKRRSSVRWGLGAIAVGSAVAGAADIVAHTGVGDWAADRAGALGNSLGFGQPGSITGGSLPEATAPGGSPGVTEVGGGPDGDTIADHVSADVLDHANDHVGAPNAASAELDFSNSAEHISSGEGWYQTMKELGVKPGDRHELLQMVGPKLHEQHPDLAYFDKQTHEWRIRMTDDGRMPDAALELIVNTAHDNNITTSFEAQLDAIDQAADQTAAPEAASVTEAQPSAAEAPNASASDIELIPHQEVDVSGLTSTEHEIINTFIKDGGVMVSVDNLNLGTAGSYRMYLKDLGVPDEGGWKDVMTAAAKDVYPRHPELVNRIDGHWIFRADANRKVPEVIKAALRQAARQRGFTAPE